MEIHASSVYDKQAHFALNSLTDPTKKQMIIIYSLAGALVAAAVIISIITEYNNYIPLFIAVVLFLLAAFIHFCLPKIMWKRISKKEPAVTEFVFTDNKVSISSLGGGMNGTVELEYNVLTRAAETKDYFFLFITRYQAFIVDKSTVTGGTEGEIRNLLTKALGAGKYKLKLN